MTDLELRGAGYSLTEAIGGEDARSELKGRTINLETREVRSARGVQPCLSDLRLCRELEDYLVSLRRVEYGLQGADHLTRANGSQYHFYVFGSLMRYRRNV